VDRDDLLIRVAWLYYIEELTQKEIARRFKVSRVTVTRLLQKARAQGLVEIRIANVQTAHLQLESSLRGEFGLKDAIVIPTPVRSEDLRPALARAASTYLDRIIQPGLQVGLGMGRTLAEIPNQMEQMDPRGGVVCHFIEMVGGIGRGLSFDSYKVSSQLADRCGGEVEHVYTPVIVETAAAREALLSDPQIRRVLERAAQSDLALVSVGTVDLDSFLYHASYSNDADIKALQELGAVGDVLGHFFDVNGRPVPNAIEERLIGLSLADLSGIPTVICVAGGLPKVPSILGATRGGYVDVLVTDESTASAMLETKGRDRSSQEGEG